MIIVGRAVVGEGKDVGRTNSVGVARVTNHGREIKLIVPAQYKTDAPKSMIKKHPYAICLLGDKLAIQFVRSGGRSS